MRLFNGKSLTGLLIFIILFICSFLLSAQEYKIGFEAGPNLSTRKFTKFSNIALSYHINGYFAYNSQGFLGISAMPGFILRGNSYGSGDNTNKQRLNLYYFHLPVLADFYLTKKLVFSIGPEPAILLHASAINYNFGNASIIDMFEKFEFSGIAGFSYRINNMLAARVSYSHAFNWFWDISLTNPNGEIIEHIYDYHRTLLFSLRCSW